MKLKIKTSLSILMVLIKVLEFIFSKKWEGQPTRWEWVSFLVYAMRVK